MRIGPLRSYAPTQRRKLLLGSVYSTILSSLFPGAVLAGDFTQSLYRSGATGQEISSPAALPGWTFTRASTAYAEGLTTETVTNKVTVFNANPTTTTGYSLVGGSTAIPVTVVDDTAALTAANLNGVVTSGKVIMLDNSAGSASSQYDIAGPTGNTNLHVASAYLRGTGTAQFRMSGVGSTNITLTSSYTRIVAAPANPTNGSNLLRILVTAGSIVYITLPQLIERSAAIAHDIVTTGATASINYGAFNGLKLFASGEPRITSEGLLVEEARTNTALNSMAPGIGAAWTISGGASTPIDGPDGGIASAARWRDTTITGGHRPSVSSTVASGSTYTLSCYARYGTRQYTRLTSAASGEQITAVFDMQNKTVSSVGAITGSATNISANIARLLDTDWYRISLTFTSAVSAGTTVLVGHASNGSYTTAADNYAGVATDYTDYFGLQFETGAACTSYIPTTSASATRAADVPLMTGYNSILGQLRTNRVNIFSANPTTTTGLSTTGDASSTATIVDDSAALAAAGLSGDASSGKVIKFDNSAGTGTANLIISGPTSSTAVHTVSVYWRGSGTGIARLEGVAASMVSIPATYQRSVLSNITPDITGRRITVAIAAGSVVYVILPQLEEGPVATAPIVTTGAAVTTGVPFTMVAYAKLPLADGVDRVAMAAYGNSTNNIVRFRRASGNDTLVTVTAAGVNQNNGTTAGMGGARSIKYAVRMRLNSDRLSTDGNLKTEATIASPEYLDRIFFGSANTSSALNGWIQKFAIFGDVDDVKLQSLTA